MTEILELSRSAIRVFRNMVGVKVECLSGILWMTREGDPRDHVLRPGDARTVEASGRVALQALSTARVRIIDAVDSRRPSAA